jgi:hypothetical protein
VPRRRRPVVTGPERNQSRSNQEHRSNLALQQVIADPATDAALLGVADVLAEIARETGGPLAQEQSLRGVKDGQ